MKKNKVFFFLLLILLVLLVAVSCAASKSEDIEILDLDALIKSNDVETKENNFFAEGKNAHLFADKFNLSKEELDIVGAWTEIFKDWSTETQIARWHKQVKNELSIIWNYRNGAILIMETESSRYSTKRGIKVGDSLEEIISAYEKDCDIYEYDSLNKKYNIVKQDEKNRFVLHKSENSISIDAANMIEEEMMEISFDLKDNSITKISILCGD